MHFVVNNVAGSAEVDGVNYFVVAVILVAVEVFGLAAVSWLKSASLYITARITHLSSERTTNHLVARL